MEANGGSTLPQEPEMQLILCLNPTIPDLLAMEEAQTAQETIRAVDPLQNPRHVRGFYLLLQCGAVTDSIYNVQASFWVLQLLMIREMTRMGHY